MFTVLPVRFACALGALARALLPRQRAVNGARSGAGGGLQGDQLFDLLCVLIFAATLAYLRLLPAGSIYFWLKDLTQEFLKLHVVHSAVEIFDKVRGERAWCAIPPMSGLRAVHAASWNESPRCSMQDLSLCQSQAGWEACMHAAAGARQCGAACDGAGTWQG